MRQARDSYERVALALWSNLKDNARLFFPWTVPVVVLWYMALSAPKPFRWVTLPVALWLTICLRERMERD